MRHRPSRSRRKQQCRRFLRFPAQKGDGIVDIPADRWDNSLFYSSEDGKGKIRTTKGGYLNDISSFDAKFFNISPKEADYLDPQQRLVLETAWEALEHAGLDANGLRGSNGGVFVGVSSIDYSLEVGALTLEENIGHIGTGTAHSAISGRVSYFLGWRGPCVSIDTACSSSLVALHQAIVALRQKECHVALCGGVNAIHHPRNLVVFSDAKMLSPSGRCRTFDDSADGYGRSEGCSMIVLKRLSDAIRDGDNIIATLRGSAVNQDGESGGLTVPNGVAQEQVMRNAINNAALTVADISYVEAHGTGTSLGDPIEVRAINSVFATSHSKDNPVHIGSVKGNIGHTEAAAGIMGVVKAALQIQSDELFPHIGMNTPSKRIPWSEYIVNVPTENTKWQAPVRRSLVNSFGFAGTISSVVLEQAPAFQRTEVKSDGQVPTVLTLSAKSKNALAGTVVELKNHLQANPERALADVANATHVRSHFNHRLAYYSDSNDPAKAIEWLENQQKKLQNEKSAGNSIEKLAFLFTGQGSQYVGMGKGYYDNSPIYREAVNLCNSMFKQHLEVYIKDIMFGEVVDAEQLLDQTQYTQAALFVVEYAMYRYWLALGLKPSCLIGHSIGEIVAACLAGVFSLEDAIHLVASRGRLMQSVTAEGGMLAVKIDREKAAGYLQDYSQLGFAALNSPCQCVISGEAQELENLKAELEHAGIEATQLAVSHAFHSRQMATIYDQFRAAISNIRFNEPEITLISNVSGKVAKFSDIGSVEYWVRHIGEPVRFADGIKALAERGEHLCLEVGPARALCSLGRQTAPDMVWVNSMAKRSDNQDSLGYAIVSLYQHGVDFDWQAFVKHQAFNKVELPFYAFDRKHHWMTLNPRYRFRFGNDQAAQGHPLLGQLKGDRNAEQFHYACELNANNPAYLVDHKVNGQVVFPGAGYIETLIAAQVDIFGETGGDISNVVIYEPLYLTDDNIEYRIECRKLSDSAYEVALVSRIKTGADNIDKRHASAVIHAATDEQDKALDLAAVNGEGLDQLSTADELYPQFEQIGLSYGDHFQRLQKIQANGESLALSQLESGHNPGEYVTASLLDCAMQSLATIVDDDKTYLPVGFDKVCFYKQPRGKLSAVLQKTSRENVDLSADLLIRDGERAVCVVRGLQLKAVKAKAAEVRQLFHTVEWKKRSIVASNDQAENTLLLLGAGASLVDTLGQQADENTYIIPASNLEQGKNEFAANTAINHVVYFSSQINDFGRIYSELLDLVRFLDSPAHQGHNLRLWLVSEMSQVVLSDDQPGNTPVCASLWGFGHTLLNEHPRWQTTLLDLPLLQNPDVAQDLLSEIVASRKSAEYQVAYRDGQRYVRYGLGLDDATSKHDNFELQVTEYGLFENVKSVAIESLAPGKGEVEIEIRAAGLNFKDVLNALGLLKLHAEEHQIEYVKLPLGFEGAGVVVAAGEDCNFEVGDKVMLSHLGCFQKRLTVTQDVVVKMPSNLGYSEAAACPTAYITSHYALHTLAQIKAGDKVLIHSAAGGVGQAAVQLAKAVGAKIYATASPRKWPMLRAQGIEHLMNSRNLDFSQQILGKTGGRGVDIILNSLNKDYIRAGLDCMADDGRFVELGKIGIWTPEQVAEYKAGVTYFNFDLSELPTAELNRVNKEILTDVAEKLSNNRYLPLPTTEYALDEVEEAFSVLSRGANKGKLVIKLSQDEQPTEPVTINSDQVYLITGGYGALGQALAQKLIELGAEHIALVGRNVVAQSILNQIKADSNATLYPLIADISDSAACEQLFAELKALGRPVGGLFHTAGVLADAPVKDLTTDSFDKVCAAKIAGTDNLLAGLDALQSDAFFVGFSSIASILGSISQANYAAANAYIDYRMATAQQAGRRSLSINWGPWADIGMAAGLSDTLIRSLEKKGMFMLKPKQALRGLCRALATGLNQITICEFDWDAYTHSLPVGNAMFSQLSFASSGNKRAQLALGELAEVGKAERMEQLLHFVRASIAQVLHYDDVDDVGVDARFADLGLDSLVAVELKSAMELALKLPLMTSLVFDYPTISALTDFLYSQLWPQTEVDSEKDDMAQIQAMSDEDIDAELVALIQ